MGRPRAASADGRGDDGSPGCSGSQAEWGCRPETSCSRQAQSRGRCPASSYGTPAKTPEAAEGGEQLLNTCCGRTDTQCRFNIQLHVIHTDAGPLTESHHSPKRSDGQTACTTPERTHLETVFTTIQCDRKKNTP